MKNFKTIWLLIVISFLYSFSIEGFINSLKEENLNGKVKSITETTYDLVDKLGEFSKGDVVEEIITQYDEKGNKIEENKNSMHEDKTIFKYKYNAKGNIIEESDYGEDSSLIHKIKYRYNEQGNIIERDWYWLSTLVEKDAYDEKGNKIQENIMLNGRLDVAIRKYKYNNKGNKVEEHGYNPNGVLLYEMKYKYDAYDEIGNWLKRTGSDGDIPLKLTEREIKYY